MSRLNKANEIIELAILMQNSYCGLTTDDIAKHFECCRRSAERMKAVLYEKFGNKIEEVTNLSGSNKVGNDGLFAGFFEVFNNGFRISLYVF